MSVPNSSPISRRAGFWRKYRWIFLAPLVALLLIGAVLFVAAETMEAETAAAESSPDQFVEYAPAADANETIPPPMASTPAVATEPYEYVTVEQQVGTWLEHPVTKMAFSSIPGGVARQTIDQDIVTTFQNFNQAWARACDANDPELFKGIAYHETDFFLAYSGQSSDNCGRFVTEHVIPQPAGPPEVLTMVVTEAADEDEDTESIYLENVTLLIPGRGRGYTSMTMILEYVPKHQQWLIRHAIVDEAGWEQ